MAMSGVGVRFMKSNMATSPVFTAIAQINDIDGPSRTRKTISTTSLDTTGGYETFIGGFRDGGTITCNMNFTNASYAAMVAEYELEVACNYEIRFPDTAKTCLQFAAIVTDVGMKIPKDDKISAPVTLKISGKVTLTAWT